LGPASLWITWIDADQAREVRLETEQIGRPVGNG